MKTVCIQCNTDEGGQETYAVGMLPEGEAPGGEDQSYLSPVKSMDAAMQVARDLLTNDQAEEAQESADLEAGYNEASGQDIAALNTRGMQ
jgi:hypothetical protein